MEVGVFAFLTIIGVLGYWKNNNLFMIPLSMVSLFIVAILLSTGQDVTMTHTTASSASADMRDINGTVTRTATGEKTDTNTDVIISSQEVEISYIFFTFAAFLGMLFFVRVMQHANTGRY